MKNTLLLIVAMSTLTFGASAEQICPRLLDALGRMALNTNPGVPPLAFNPKVDVLPDSIAALLLTTQGDPIYGPRYERQLPSNPTMAQRLVAMGKDTDLRRLLVQAAHSDLIRRSNIERARVATGTRRVKVLIAGAGLVEQNLQNSLRQQDLEVDTLTIEPTGVVASTFSRGGAAFSLNSTSRAADTTSLRQGISAADDSVAGDLNFLAGGALQVNQFDSRTNPLARSWAEAAMVNRSLAPGNIVFNDSIVSFSPADPTSQDYKDGYTIIGNLASGGKVAAMAAVTTNAVDSVIPDLPGLRELYANFGPRQTRTAPRVFTFPDFLEYVNSTPNPYKAFAGKRVGVGGPGDSGKGVVRFGLRLSDPEAYADDSSETPLLRGLYWYGQTATSCETFIARNRAFYADIGRGFRSGKILPRDRISAVTVGDQDVFKVSQTTGETDDLDVLILTLGQESRLATLLAPYTVGRNTPTGNAFVEDPTLFKPVLAFEPKLGQVTIARQFVDPRSGKPTAIFALGPNAGRIVSDPELVNVPENNVANVNHSWRAYRFGEPLAEGLGTARTQAAPLTREAWQAAADIRNEGFRPKTVPSSIAGPQPGDNLLFVSELYSAFRQYDLRRVPELTITVARTSEDAYTFRVDPPLLNSQLMQVLKNLSRNEVFGNLLNRNLGPKQRYKALTVLLRLNNGALDGDRSAAQLSKDMNAEVAKGNSPPIVTPAIVASLREFIQQPGATGPRGLTRTAKYLFENNMAQTYDVAVQVYGLDAIRRMGWYRFDGSLEEHDRLRAFFFVSPDGRSYADSGTALDPIARFIAKGAGGMSAAALIFDGDVTRAYDAAAQIFGADYLKKVGWYRFTQGNRQEHDRLRAFFFSIARGRSYADNGEGPVAVSSTLSAYGAGGMGIAASFFDGNITRAYDGAVEIFGAAYVQELGWYRFTQGDRTDHDRLRAFFYVSREGRSYRDSGVGPVTSIGSIRANGVSGFREAAETYFGDDMGRTYDAAVEMFGAAYVESLGWYRFSGTAAENRGLANAIGDNRRVIAKAGQEAVAGMVFGGDLARTYDAAVQVYGENAVAGQLGWRRILPQ